MKPISDLEIQHRFRLGMQMYRDEVEAERQRFRRQNPEASEEDVEVHISHWHLKLDEWNDPAFRVRKRCDF